MIGLGISYFGILLAFTICVIFKTICVNVSHFVRSRQLGCKPAFTRPSRLPFGIDILKRALDATKDQRLQDDDLKVYEELGQRATWNQNILGSWHHVTSDPNNIQAILAKQFNDFDLGPIRRGSFAPLIGHGIFTSDGEDWQHSRTLLRPQFARAQVADLQLEDHVQNLLQRIPVHYDSWTDSLDLMPLFFNLTLDSATQFLFGESVNSQIIGAKSTVNATTNQLDWSSFGQSFDAANLVVSYRSRLMDLYYLYSPTSFRKNCQRVHRFAEYYVNKALTGSLPSKGKPNSEGSSTKHRYVFLQELAKATSDPLELRSQVLNILLAGRDTTAGLLSWTFYLLARHPNVYAKLRSAILDQFGSYSSGHAAISFESLKSCSFLQHVLSEVLRLYPVVPENSRRAVRNTTLPRGGGPDGLSPIYIRAGEEVVYNVNIMHRRADLWGKDAHEFHPERWLHKKPGWDYLPFNGGPRICLGQQFALTEAGYVIVRMLQKYDRLENLDKSTITRQRYTSTTSPVQVLVRLHEAAQ